MEVGIKKIFKEISAEIKIEEMKRISTGKKDREEIVCVKMENEEDKKQIWDKKRRLKRRKVWIEENLSWKEGKVKRKIGMIAGREKKKGKKCMSRGG